MGKPSPIPGASTFAAGLSVEYSSTVDTAWGRPHPDHEGCLLSLNLVAMIILVTAVMLFPKRTSPQVSPPGSEPAHSR
jgi:hypothetical protein